LLDCVPAWEGNWTWDCFVAFAWECAGQDRLLVAVNYAPQQSQCYVRLPFPALAGRTLHLKDRMGNSTYERTGNDLLSKGLYLDLPPWGYHVFTLSSL
jgi:hypothetical protein